MKSKFATFALLFAAVFSLASCLKDDEVEYVYTDDTLITSFVITAAKQQIPTKNSKGEYSTSTVVTSLYNYRFCIDQNASRIYNPDSLPYGVDLSRMLCSVVSINSSRVVIKNIDGGLSDITNTDSIDFSVPRELQVFSNSGKTLRKYTVDVYVHKEYADSFKWAAMPDAAPLQQMSYVRPFCLTQPDGTKKLLVFGNTASGLALQTYTTANGWSEVDFNEVSPADIRSSLSAANANGFVAKGDSAYIATDGKVLATTDGMRWDVRATNSGITRLVAASPVRLYGYNAAGEMMASTDRGITWAPQAIDDAPTLLPNDEVVSLCQALKTNAGAYRVLLMGQRAETTADKKQTLVWGKIDEADSKSHNQPWNYYDVTSDMKHTAPLMTSASAINYDGKAYVLGRLADGTVALYASVDGGITWSADKVLTLPADFAAGTTPAFSMVADADNFVWLVNASQGKVWRARINRLGWKTVQNNFSE